MRSAKLHQKSKAMTTRKHASAQTAPSIPTAAYAGVHEGIVALVHGARNAAARSVNALMAFTYWEIGRRIVEAEQQGKRRAGHGDALTKRPAVDLTAQFGRGFGWRNLFQMRTFYLAWPDILQKASGIFAIAATADRRLQTASAISETALSPATSLAAIADRFPLPWSAYVRLLSVRHEPARQFYEAEALRGGWSVRQLDRQINSQFYERVALSRNKASMLSKGAVAKPRDVVAAEGAIKGPYVLEFLELKDEYSESQLEATLIERLETFLLELGGDFAFIGRQQPRLRIDDQWFRVDLLLFNRRLGCLVVIDLKIGSFTHADAGQMHMYLNYAREHWALPGENPPVGLILCASRGTALARCALEGLPNKVLAAEYKTAPPDEEVLAAELDKTRQQLAAVKPIRKR
jgi:predicted nuclease of restriction endonuclease-like (RecB) superfamily